MTGVEHSGKSMNGSISKKRNAMYYNANANRKGMSKRKTSRRKEIRAMMDMDKANIKRICHC